MQSCLISKIYIVLSEKSSSFWINMNAALDFQQRCIASKTPRTATIGCAISGCLCLALGIPFSYLGSIARVYYGPDTPYATYETDVRIMCTRTSMTWLSELLTNEFTVPHFCNDRHVTSVSGCRPAPCGCRTMRPYSSYLHTKHQHSLGHGVLSLSLLPQCRVRFWLCTSNP